MRAAIITVIVNVLLTIAITTPLWLNKVPGAHAGIALATALAGIVNAWLLWRYLRRDGLLVPQPGWGAFLLKMLVACVVMTAVVLAARHFVGDWRALGSVWHRVAWLFAAILAGALAYGGTQVAMGLRPRHLRH